MERYEKAEIVQKINFETIGYPIYNQKINFPLAFNYISS